MTHDTLKTFGYPETLIAGYKHWAVVLRPKQTTLGALVVISKSDAVAYADLPESAFAEFRKVTQDIERTLSNMFSYDKINYLMLMMVDPHVHYHVIPRYAASKSYADTVFEDTGWPGVPDLSKGVSLNDNTASLLRDDIKKKWSE